jgi:hypothetical protein
VPAWWLGLLEDILVNYPELDGIELREPVINWWGAEADYNPHAVAAFRKSHPAAPLGGQVWLRWRAEGLTALLKQSIRLVRRYNKSVHLTTVMSSWGDGRLLTAAEQAANTGFDLDAVLSGEDRPDVIKVGLIWQQWGNIYDYVTFTPEWTGRATREALAMLEGRVRPVIHVELTDFGARRVTPQEVYLAIRASRLAGARDFDVYGAKQADDKNAWPWLERAFLGKAVESEALPHQGPARRVLVIQDDDPTATTTPRLATTLLVNLLGHFDLTVEVRPASEYRPSEVHDFDTVIYQGTMWDALLPSSLLADLHVYSGHVLWIGANLWQLTRGDAGSRFGMAQRVPVQQVTADALTTPSGRLTAGPQATFLAVAPTPTATVLATADLGAARIPVAATNGRFWYVGGYLHRDPDRNPVHLLVADLLHDVLRTPHPRALQALLYITGVTPVTDPAQLQRLRSLIDSLGVQPLIGVTPVFVDPVMQTRITLDDRPRIVGQLRALFAAGAEIVLVGYTHQLRGRTGADYEFWDALKGTARTDDSEEMVRERVNAGLRALSGSRLFPVAWGTPGNLASPFDYTQFGKIFSVQVERRFYAFAEGRPILQQFPYLVTRDVHGHTVLTPNPLLDPRRGDEAVLATAREIATVRDGLAVVPVPVHAAPEAIGRLVRALKQIGYTFTQVRMLQTIRVHGEDVFIASGEARFRIDLEQGASVREIALAPDGIVRVQQMRRVVAPERYEPTVRTAAGEMRVIEILRVHPRAPQVLIARTRFAARQWLQSWDDTRGWGRVGLVARSLMIMVSAIMLAALAFTLLAVPLLLLASLARNFFRTRRVGHAP